MRSAVHLFFNLLSPLYRVPPYQNPQQTTSFELADLQSQSNFLSTVIIFGDAVSTSKL